MDKWLASLWSGIGSIALAILAIAAATPANTLTQNLAGYVNAVADWHPFVRYGLAFVFAAMSLLTLYAFALRPLGASFYLPLRDSARRCLELSEKLALRHAISAIAGGDDLDYFEHALILDGRIYGVRPPSTVAHRIPAEAARQLHPNLEPNVLVGNLASGRITFQNVTVRRWDYWRCRWKYRRLARAKI